MNLSPVQTEAVAGWFAAGASLDEIQKRIASEFGIHMTYLDLRLLVADFPQPEEKEEPAEIPPVQEQDSEPPVPPAGEPDTAPDAPPDQDPSPSDPAESDIPPAGSVSVTVDPITPPGVMAGGGVTFSDGTEGKWYLDQMGRLGLGGVPQGYRPSPEDAALFQSRLVEALQAKGLM